MEGERARSEREDSDVLICLRCGPIRTKVKKKQRLYIHGQSLKKNVHMSTYYFPHVYSVALI